MKPCILPWINFGTNTFGRPRACGYSKEKSPSKLNHGTIADHWNSEYFANIRKDFLSGNWPSNCDRCRYVEEMGGRSKRMEENSYFYDEYSKYIASTDSDGKVDYYPPHLDIRVGTICNQKCIHCGTGASSKWKEDKILLGKYENTELYNIDNKWIEHDTVIWDNMLSNISEVKKFNFLGGEPFANKQHNRFIKLVSGTPYAKDITLSYVTNATLLDDKLLNVLSKFKKVYIRVSLDAVGDVAEYFRYPMNWQSFCDTMDMIDTFSKSTDVFDIAMQWTCSNISMWYASDTFETANRLWPRFEVLLCNHVDWPKHMSAQVLPEDLKKTIQNKDYGTYSDAMSFYINHMNGRDGWNAYGSTFMQYLDDLDAARKCDWRSTLSQMELPKYDSRKTL